MKALTTHLTSFKKRKYDKNLENQLINKIDLEIRVATSDKNELLANHLWMLKSILLAQNYYLRFIEFLGRKKYYEAWCILERCEITINNLNRHIDEELAKKYYFYFLKFQIPRWQKIFPYNLFASPEFMHKKVRCNICNTIRTPRNSCHHLVGELYFGQICNHIIEEFEIISVAIVKNPVMKSNVIDPEGENKNFSGLHIVLDTLSTPFQYWDINYTRKYIPNNHIVKSSPDMSCPCNSGLSYMLCCQRKHGCLIPHLQIIPYSQNIKEKLNNFIDIELQISNYLYQLRYS